MGAALGNLLPGQASPRVCRFVVNSALDSFLKRHGFFWLQFGSVRPATWCGEQ
jgi:hypothetical protein